MPAQLRFEGRDLEKLLDRVQAEAGEDANIVSAERVRSGGVLGFFARERFEVTVEVDPDELSDQPPEQDPQQAAGQAAGEAAGGAPEPTARRPASLAELAGQIDEAEQAATPRLSTETAQFAEVFGRIVAEANPPTQPIPATPGVPDDAAARAEPGPVVVPTPRAGAAAAGILTYRPMAGPVGRAAAELGKLGLAGSLLPARFDPRDPFPALLDVLGCLPDPPPLPAGPGVIAVVGERDAGLDLARELSGRLGLDPAEVALASPAYGGRRVPGRLVLRGADAAADQRRSWRRRPRPTIVAVDARLGERSTGWAYHLLAALEPAAAWGIVAATDKPEDVAAWCAALGGLDALAVDNLNATSSPAAILQVGIPVARIDGRPASPALWAALLAERLAA